MSKYNWFNTAIKEFYSQLCFRSCSWLAFHYFRIFPIKRLICYIFSINISLYLQFVSISPNISRLTFSPLPYQFIYTQRPSSTHSFPLPCPFTTTSMATGTGDSLLLQVQGGGTGGELHPQWDLWRQWGYRHLLPHSSSCPHHLHLPGRMNLVRESIFTHFSVILKGQTCHSVSWC